MIITKYIYILIVIIMYPKKVFTHIGFKEKEKTIYIISINDLYKYIKND